MESCQALKKKWRQRLKQGTAGHNFDLDKLAPGKFCVLYSDIGGSGACSSTTELIGFFQDEQDFLAFLRFTEIPRVLDFDTGTLREPFVDVADAYLLKYEGEERERIDHLIGRIDRVLKSLNGEMIAAPELSRIFEKFNEAFESTNPTVQILAWGSLADVLRSVEEETDEDEKPATALKNLLDAGEFDEGNNKHLLLAKKFLAQRVCA